MTNDELIELVNELNRHLPSDHQIKELYPYNPNYHDVCMANNESLVIDATTYLTDEQIRNFPEPWATMIDRICLKHDKSMN